MLGVSKKYIPPPSRIMEDQYTKSKHLKRCRKKNCDVTNRDAGIFARPKPDIMAIENPCSAFNVFPKNVPTGKCKMSSGKTKIG
jgi:hypothetical protein